MGQPRGLATIGHGNLTNAGNDDPNIWVFTDERCPRHVHLSKECANDVKRTFGVSVRRFMRGRLPFVAGLE